MFTVILFNQNYDTATVRLGCRKFWQKRNGTTSSYYGVKTRFMLIMGNKDMIHEWCADRKWEYIKTDLPLLTERRQNSHH